MSLNIPFSPPRIDQKIIDEVKNINSQEIIKPQKQEVTNQLKKNEE